VPFKVEMVIGYMSGHAAVNMRLVKRNGVPMPEGLKENDKSYGHYYANNKSG
jgi:hypothetical protein